MLRGGDDKKERRGGGGETSWVQMNKTEWEHLSSRLFLESVDRKGDTDYKGGVHMREVSPPPPKKKTQIRLTEDEKKRLDKRKNLIRLGASSNASAAVSFIVPVLLFCYQQLSALFCFISRSPAVSHSTSLRTFSSDSDHSCRLLGSVPRHGFVCFFVCFIL